MIIALLLSIVLLPWWPGGSNRWSSEPVYPHRVKVVDLVRGNAWYQGNLRTALKEWNRCGANIRLVYSQNEPDAYTPGTITLFVDNDGQHQDGPYGGWVEDHGIVALAGGWTRSRQVIAHELGHALGFGHAPSGANSIMDGPSHVTASDCRGLRHYY